MEGYFLFSSIKIPKSNVFFRLGTTFAFVNLRPLTFGHVLIIPERVVSRIKDLTKEEMKDLFDSARRITSRFEEEYGLAEFKVAL